MKIKKGFAKRNIAGSNIVVPVGEGVNVLNGMITLNESGSFIWDCLSKDRDMPELVKMLTSEYDVDNEKAADDISKFLDILRQNNLLEE